MRFWSRHDLLRAAEGETSGAGGGGDGAGGGGGDTKTTEPPDWFKTYSTQMEQRLEKMQAKNLERFKSLDSTPPAGAPPQTETPPVAPPSNAITEADAEAIVRYGELRGQLPKDAREYVESVREDSGYAEAVRTAEAIAKFAPPATGGGPGASPRPGYGATPAPRQPASASLPKTRAEWNRLAQHDPKAFAKASEQAKQDPTYTMPTV